MANRLRVVRQVRYSQSNENCIDLVLFLNGLPVATVELTTDFTQSVQDTVDHYQFDRDPRPKCKPSEPLLNFPGGALAHFAMSDSEVQMSTRLNGPEIKFLPFNRGDNGAAGNCRPLSHVDRDAPVDDRVDAWPIHACRPGRPQAGRQPAPGTAGDACQTLGRTACR